MRSSLAIEMSKLGSLSHRPARSTGCAWDRLGRARRRSGPSRPISSALPPRPSPAAGSTTSCRRTAGFRCRSACAGGSSCWGSRGHAGGLLPLAARRPLPAADREAGPGRSEEGRGGHEEALTRRSGAR
jgi:hypothetical protein